MAGAAHLGIDFAWRRRVSTAVRQARLEKSEGRVRGIGKIHGRSSVPLRQRLAMIPRASASEANHCGAAVTGLNDASRW